MLRDDPAEIVTVASTTEFQGKVISVTKDVFHFAEQLVTRDVVRHPGAVAVVALRNLNSTPEILLVRQYRHPVKRYLWELPAGLRDVDGETATECARRELQEETGFDATDFELLVTSATTPGGSDELISLYLTVDPSELPERPRSGDAEESDMTAQWITVTEAVSAVENSQILNGAAQIGILLAARWVRQAGEIGEAGL